MNIYIQPILNISWQPSFTHCYLVTWFRRQRGAEIGSVFRWHVTIKSVLLIQQDWIYKVLDQQQIVHDWNWALCLFHSTVAMVLDGFTISCWINVRFQCYFRGIYIATFSWLEVNSVMHQNTLNEVSNSCVWLFTPIPTCYHARLLCGLVHVWPVWDTVQFPLQSEDEKRQIDRWRGGTQGSMRSDSRSIV